MKNLLVFSGVSFLILGLLLFFGGVLHTITTGEIYLIRGNDLPTIGTVTCAFGALFVVIGWVISRNNNNEMMPSSTVGVSGAGVVNPSEASVEGSTEEDSEEDSEEEDPSLIAKNDFAGLDWKVLKIDSALDKDGVWVYLLYLVDSENNRKTLEVTGDHDFIDDFRFLNPGNKISFEHTEEYQSDYGEDEWISDFLIPRPPQTSVTSSLA